MSDYPMLISNKLHSFRNFGRQSYSILLIKKRECLPLYHYRRIKTTKTNFKLTHL